VAKDGTVTHGIQIAWGSVLGSTLQFLITATVVYFLMVLPMSKYLARVEARRKAREGTKESVVEVTELEVLQQIRDTLVTQRGGDHDARTPRG
jgi:large conductance mechanosensitive channel